MSTLNADAFPPEGAKERLVVIGNGMAGMRTVEELLKVAPDMYDITVFGSEPRVNYNRIMLSPVLAGEKTFEDIIINDQAWYDDNNITLHSGDPVTAIDRAARVVTSASGLKVPFDRLLLATGSNPIMIPIPGHKLPGVISFRDLDDVDTMIKACGTSTHAVVIGGGLLGLEAAYGLSKRGMQVTVLHLMPTLMERQLDVAAGHLLQQELERRGIEIITQADTAEITGEAHVTGVKLKDGRDLKADLVVMAVGIRPNGGLAEDTGLEVERGIVVDDFMTTSDPAIFSVGECVQHRGVCYGLVAPLWEMAKTCAAQLAHVGGVGYTGSVTSTKLKVSGVDLFSAGTFQTDDEVEDIVYRDAARGVYKRLVVKDNALIGAVLYGETTDGAWYFSMIKSGEDISDIRDTMVFGQNFASSEVSDPSSAVAALPLDAEICGCNGVCKGDIVTAIQDNDLTSLADVRAHTKASSSCGSCTGLVENLLAVTLGEEYVAQTGPKPMCGCTDKDHDTVRRLIVAQGIKSIPEAMQALEWTTPEGCASCRPALNYYLLCALPGEYVDDARSRFINERVHANIQKDGTYSVVPRMWGGLTSSKELRAIADVVDKFDIPTVKVTGGQRIDLFGVKKEDLPAVWGDLNAAGMVSGHAYGKSLRTVKTCVGSEWCRFGTQDSTGLGVQLEEGTWGSWMPHKFKMAVSGCPRNCAEATIKDFGVVCVDSGYELHIGGNGGITVRATDFLTRVETEEEVKEWCYAFIQLYRETGWYLERTAPWVERLGLDCVKERLEQEDVRKDLHDRFLKSQETSQDDPWAERATQKVDAGEFKSLATIQ